VNQTTAPSDQRWALVSKAGIDDRRRTAMKGSTWNSTPFPYYEASLQMKANNGLFIVDDFGRQQIEPGSF
jgi:hypothetical protein